MITVLSEELAALEVLLPEIIPDFGIDVLSTLHECHVVSVGLQSGLDGCFNEGV